MRRGEGHALDVERGAKELPAGLEEDVDQERQMGEGMARTGEDAEMGQEVRWSLWDVLAGAKAMASPNLARDPIFFLVEHAGLLPSCCHPDVHIPILG